MVTGEGCLKERRAGGGTHSRPPPPPCANSLPCASGVATPAPDSPPADATLALASPIALAKSSPCTPTTTSQGLEGEQPSTHSVDQSTLLLLWDLTNRKERDTQDTHLSSVSSLMDNCSLQWCNSFCRRTTASSFSFKSLSRALDLQHHGEHEHTCTFRHRTAQNSREHERTAKNSTTQHRRV